MSLEIKNQSSELGLVQASPILRNTCCELPIYDLTATSTPNDLISNETHFNKNKLE